VTGIWGPSLDIVNVKTTAIAAFPMLPGGQTCLLAVGSDTTVSATLNLPNCALASLSTSGSSIVLSGSGDSIINAAAIATAGNIVIGSKATLPPHTYTYLPLQDPYRNVTIIKPTGTCATDPNWRSSTLLQLPSGFYCGLTFSGAANVHLNPGIYYVDGGNFSITALTDTTSDFNLRTSAPSPAGNTLTFCTQGTCTGSVTVGMTVTDTTHSMAIKSGTTVTAVGNQTVTISNAIINPPAVQSGDWIHFFITPASVTGTDITIVLTATGGGSAGGVDIDPGPMCSATVLLTGPGAGLLLPSAAASQGLLFFQDPTAVIGNTPNTITVGASDPSCTTSNVILNGAIYTPASATTLQGNAVAGAKGCTEVIAQSFDVSGNPGFDDSACSAAGITLKQAQIQQVYLAM
jgi:hypothetical protein